MWRSQNIRSSNLIERSFREMVDRRRIMIVRTRETPSCKGAGYTAGSSSEIVMPQDSNASADCRAVTAGYDSAKARGESSTAEFCAPRIALFSVSSVSSVSSAVRPKPKFQKMVKNLVSVVFSISSGCICLPRRAQSFKTDPILCVLRMLPSTMLRILL